MITFSKFGNHGNLGNHLFQYASLIGLSKKYGHQLGLPDWKYKDYFDHEFPILFPIDRDKFVKEEAFHYTPDFWTEKLSNPSEKIDILGWLQSEKYWSDVKPAVNSALRFKEEFCTAVLDKLKPDEQKETIAISIRRGDFVGNPNYELLPINYYINALLENFPDWKDYELIIFSDNIPYCKVHFGSLPNVKYAEGLNAIEQLCAMSLCDHFIIANSTFSWWGAYLGEDINSKVIRPAYHFAGDLLRKSDWKDHYPDRWIVYDHKKKGITKKIDLRDVTFTIPVSYDHPDRLANLQLSVAMLQKDFDTNIVIMEHGHQKHFSHMSAQCEYRVFYNQKNIFHRTKMLNDMAKMATTPIIVNWDADILIPPMQILETVDMLRTGMADMAYPYDGRFARVNRKTWFDKISLYKDTGVFEQTDFEGTRDEDTRSDGGAVFFNREKFIAGGMENEHFLSYGPEDRERYIRFLNLKYTIGRVAGILYHLDHWRGSNSTAQHEHFSANKEEYRKVAEMDEKSLLEYVDSWPWKNFSGPRVRDEQDKRFDVVIPLGDGSPWQNNELRYALRSIEKHLLNYRDIYIIGADPGFLNDQVTVIPFPDNSAYNRGKNIFEKICRACEENSISDRFVFTNDDIFLTRDMDAFDLGYYHRGSLKASFEILKAGNTYRVQLKNTWEALKKKELPAFDYDIHFPIVYRKKNFLALAHMYDWGIPYGFGIKSLYSNTYCVEGQSMTDLKITGRLSTSGIESHIQHRKAFSVSDGGLYGEMKPWLQEKYPTPSKWEK